MEERSQSLKGGRLTFEANRGQAEKGTRFLTYGAGCRLSLTRQGAVLDLAGPGEAERTDPAQLRIRLLNSNRRPAMRGVWKSRDRVSVIQRVGLKPRRRRIPTFEKVVYERVYPGINMVFYGQPSRLEYDFILNPRANPKRIRLAFEGAERVELTEGGDLMLTTLTGVVRQQKPVMYQVIDGVQREVSGGYRLEADGSVSFEVGPYDPARHLVIDPILTYLPHSEKRDVKPLD